MSEILVSVNTATRETNRKAGMVASRGNIAILVQVGTRIWSGVSDKRGTAKPRHAEERHLVKLANQIYYHAPATRRRDLIAMVEVEDLSYPRSSQRLSIPHLPSSLL